jgi:putative nucleotidyltransferase with HDIG domain
MLKKIATDQLLAGMYVHAVCGSWLNNPFWSNSFMLATAIDVSRLQASRVQEVWIDTAKGKDVAAPAASTGESEEACAAPPPPAPMQPASTGAELERAARIVQQSQRAVAAMFEDARMGRIADLGQAGPLVEEISASVLRNPGALVSLVRLKQADDYTYMHSVAVCAMMVMLARQLRLTEDEVYQCGIAGLLHDIGKMSIPQEVLNKPGKLTDAEFSSMREHPWAGYRLLREAGSAHVVTLDVCLHHHERCDGAGYPHQLRDRGLSLYARMAAVCDVYDAITSNRPYKAAWSPAASLRRMATWSHTGQFDPKVFSAFVQCIGIYPLGSLVRLRSDRLAVVVDSSDSLLAPMVRAFFSIKSMCHIPLATINLSLPNCPDAIVSHEEAETWGLGELSHYWTP